ncbi:MAG: hypothetical protein J6M43_01570 [Neisseriaceae bacterium]|nr:hypothetical protein [Neisseriaceae bacterium]
MQDFTQIGNSQNDNFADNEAQKTLDTVINDWQSGKQVVEWTVIPPVNAQEQERKINIMKYSIYSTDALIVIVALFLYFNNSLGLDKTTALVLLAGMILVAVVSVFVSTPLLLKNMRKNLHNAITIKIDRNKKLAMITRSQQQKKVKYGQQGVLPSFRLPETNRSQYAEKRSTLQQQITAETGFLFEETV